MSGNPGQYNHQWSASDGTNVHWHATAMHDFFKGSPFNYSGMDYQMRGYINNGSGTNGAANGTDIFFGSQGGQPWARSRDVVTQDRKSTRLNSSHVAISYAVFCLKKKRKASDTHYARER